jgi:hypothetical protein
MIDPATPTKDRSTGRKKDGKLLLLTMSDEFSQQHRNFEKGKDAIFEAVHKPDDTNEAIQFCE